MKDAYVHPSEQLSPCSPSSWFYSLLWSNSSFCCETKHASTERSVSSLALWVQPGAGATRLCCMRTGQHCPEAFLHLHEVRRNGSDRRFQATLSAWLTCDKQTTSKHLSPKRVKVILLWAGERINELSSFPLFSSIFNRQSAPLWVHSEGFVLCSALLRGRASAVMRTSYPSL